MRNQCARIHFVCLFLLIFHACFNIVYLGYIICKNAFVYSEFIKTLTIVNINESQ